MKTIVQFSNKTKAYLVRVILAVLLLMSIGVVSVGWTTQVAADGLAKTDNSTIRLQLPAAESPSNDDFPGTPINSIPFEDLNVDVSGATSAVDDPAPITGVGDCSTNQGDASVWYSYNPGNQNMYVFLDTIGSDYDTVLAVWTGSQGNLTLVACDDDISLNEIQSKVILFAQANTTYYIEIVEHDQPPPSPEGAEAQATTLNFHASDSGVIFEDVPPEHWAFSYIQDIFFAGITSGCSATPLLYCPSNSVSRAQMAIFLLKGIHGSGYTPPDVGGSTGFNDVPTTHWAAAWIKQLAAEGITAGCGDGNYCPANPVTRAQMAVFLLKSKYGSGYTPPAVGASTGFNDVPTTHWAAAWIKQLAAEGITGGCGGGNYCPNNSVTRAQMAVFLKRTFGL